MTHRLSVLSLTIALSFICAPVLAQSSDLPDAPQENWIPGSGDTPTTSFVPDVQLTLHDGFPGQVEAAARAMIDQSQLVSGPAPSRILKLGDQGEDVTWLVQALEAHGYRIVMATTSSEFSGSADGFAEPQVAVFDASLDAALRAFQTENSLAVDGVAGPGVYGRLTQDNRAVGAAASAWAANLYRWSNEARAAGHDRMIVVNIPSYTLHAIDLNTNEEVIQSRVIVGKAGTRTPLMMSRMVNLKANPDWTPPKSIRGARYQRPGPNNALGLMRFSLDNNMSIYLHDTNARQLYANERRALSAGCVRVQEWKPLAAWSAREDEAWVDDTALTGGKTRFLKVDTIPVILTYSRTDLVDGTVHQYADVYNRSERAIGYAELNGGTADTWTWTQGR